jgi:hypothetical protein
VIAKKLEVGDTKLRVFALEGEIAKTMKVLIGIK